MVRCINTTLTRLHPCRQQLESLCSSVSTLDSTAHQLAQAVQDIHHSSALGSSSSSSLGPLRESEEPEEAVISNSHR